MKQPPKLSWLNYRAVLLAALAFALALLAVAFSFLAKAEPIQPGAIEKVIDGDTIKALGMTIRLIGFDAPEANSHARCEAERKLAHRATSRLRQLVAGAASASHWCRATADQEPKEPKLATTGGPAGCSRRAGTMSARC